MRAVENGIIMFDMPERVCQVDLEQWEPLLAWADSVFFPATIAHDSIRNGHSPGQVVPLRPVDSRPMVKGVSRLTPQEVAPAVEKAHFWSRLLPDYLLRRH